MADLKRLSDQ